MVRRQVDLPDPDGPMITTFSPGIISRLMSLRAANWPKNFHTPRMEMMGASVPFAGAAAVSTVTVIARQPPFRLTEPFGEQQGDNEVYQGDDGVGLEVFKGL